MNSQLGRTTDDPIYDTPCDNIEQLLNTTISSVFELHLYNATHATDNTIELFAHKQYCIVRTINIYIGLYNVGL